MQKIQRESIVFLIVSIFMFAALAIYGYLGIFTRYMADDYYTAAALRENGFWGAQQFWWLNWSGRYSFTFLVSLVELFGLRIVPILPALVISTWVFGIIWVCLPFLNGLKFNNPVGVGIFIASVTLWMSYRSVDDYPQIVFWQTGILTYPISPILFLLGSGMVVRRLVVPARIRWVEFGLWLLFAFLGGGFSETGVAIQAMLLVTLMILVPVIKVDGNKRKNLYSILLASLCGSLASLLVISISPGNLIRSGSFQNIPPLGSSIMGLLVETLLFIPKLIDGHTTTFALGFLSGFFIVYFCLPGIFQMSKLSFVKILAASLLFVEAGICAGIMPAYILRGSIPPERVLLFPYFLVACLVLYWGGLGAVYFRSALPKLNHFIKWMSLSFLLVIMSISVVPYFLSQLQLILPLREYSLIWDERHRLLNSASTTGVKVFVVEDLSRVQSLRLLRSRLWITGDFETIPDYWINHGAELFYDVDQIIAK